MIAMPTLLHLSDLHFRDDEEEKTDRGVVLDPLLERLEADYKNGLRPELVLINGDIAFQGIETEYDQALPFLQDLLRTLELGPERLYMVPGNHDVYRKAYRPTETLNYSTNREINAEFANADYRADLFKGMRAYFDFTRKHFPHLASEHGDLVPFVDLLKLDGVSLGLVGLNSAWMCRTPKEGEDDSGRIAIGEHQIKSAFQELRAKGEAQATVVLFHHPLNWLAPKDRRVGETHLDKTIALAGHLHEPGGGFFHQFSGQMAHVQAGGAYLGSDSGWPSRYHYMSIDPAAGCLLFEFRTFSGARHQWIVDSETGDDSGKRVIPAAFLGAEVKTAAASAEPARALPEFPESYAVWLRENLGHLDADKLHAKGKARPLSLPELYVPLYGADPTLIKEMAEVDNHPKRYLKNRLDRGEVGFPEDPDLETLPGKTKALLIEGQASSGKSTLMKHLAYTVSPATDTPPAVPELIGYLPVLIPLKELQAYCIDDITKPDHARPVAEEMLDWCLRNRMSGALDLDTVLGFAKCGRLLLLIDGLDEIDLTLRNHAVNALADLLLPHAENKIILAGRPHWLEGAPTNRFGKHKTSVKDLNPEQIARFIGQWFDNFYADTGGVGKKTAAKMLAEIQAHEAVRKLTVNPLMLTAICLLYMDDRELPNQRAELLKKFIDNMIWRRFDEPEAALDLLKKLAHDMHKRRARLVDKCTAVDSISGPAEPGPERKQAACRRRAEKLFDHLEPRCGLLVNENGQTGFWHLIFQEFLTAMHLLDTSRDYHQAVAAYWNDDWYKEVIELYVSYLSIDHRLTANDVIQRVVDGPDESPYRRWRLAARTLVDFHATRRNPKVVQAVRDRLKLVIQKPLEPATLVDAGESLGWLGDDRDLEGFAPIPGGEYDLEKIGTRIIEPFELARYPVTNQWYSRFVEAGGYANEAWWTDQGKRWLRSKKPKRPATWDDRKFCCPNQPVTGVNWYEAAAFCNWLTEGDADYRYFLPSSEQWQAAAAGKEGRKYPWGDASPTGRCNTRESNIGRPSPVGIFAGDCTPGEEGETIHDLAGNVLEWTCTNVKTGKPGDDFLFSASVEKQMNAGVPLLKGGSWDLPVVNARCASRNEIYPDFRGRLAGFRCARTKK